MGAAIVQEETEISNAGETPEIPRVLREIPPEKFRELIEALLGGPLQHQTSGSRREVVENPSDDQRRLPNDALTSNRILLRHCHESLLFETDWRPLDDVRESAISAVQATYVGAAMESRFMSAGTEDACAGRWAEYGGAGTGCAGGPPAGDVPKGARRQNQVDLQGIVERVEREADEA